MPTVAQVEWPSMGLKYGKLFKISSVVELHEYWQECRSNRAREGFANYINSRECSELTDGKRNGNHFHHADALLIHASCMRETAEETPRTVVEVAVEILDKLFQGMQRTLVEHGPIYINSVGGYFNLVGDMEESKVRTVDQWVIPGEDIRLKQWPHGIHWYAYVGSASVVRDGVNKWGTKEEAKKNAIAWAKENNILLEKEAR